MAEILDNSPELDLADPKTTELLDSLRTGDPVKEVETKDVKPKAEVSSPEPRVVEKEEEPDLESQVKGLKAELSRRQGNAEKVHELEVELARLQGEMKAKPAGGDPLLEAFQKMDEKDLISKQVDWEAELAFSTAKWERAEENQNQDALRLAGERITHAKRVLSIIRGEMIDRGDRKFTQRNQQAQEANAIEEELEGMYDTVSEAFPDFQDQSSDLWKAGNEEFLANPVLMSKLGPAGEVVAAAMAVIKNPTLTKGVDQATRKTVLKGIDKGFGKVLQAGTTSPNSSRTSMPFDVSSGEGLAKFNQYIDELKAGK